MVGRAGASQDAPVSSKAGKANSARPATRTISLFCGGSNHHLPEAVLWPRLLVLTATSLPSRLAPQQISPISPNIAIALLKL
ncbi:ash family protein [Scandinavium sp. NPDC088450]|uniref:ash family protein n=1 Tax=Scandinavium sp. NPDC088450 TaxID=3364514 RepID=UPI00384EA1BC